MGQMENISFEAKKPEQADPNMVVLARNLLQVYRIQQEAIKPELLVEDRIKEDAVFTKAVVSSGQAFGDWLKTPDGEETLGRYVQAHSQEEIEHFDGMDDLVAKYNEYHSKSVH